MRNDVTAARRWPSAGIGVGRAVLVRAAGGSPLEAGSTLLVADHRRIAGSVSAGCVEGAALEAVLAARRGSFRELVRYGVTDERAAEVGLGCGSVIDVLGEPEVPEEVLRDAEDERAVAMASPLHGRRPCNGAGREGGPRREEEISSGSLGALQADRELAAVALPTLEAAWTAPDLVAPGRTSSLRPARSG